MIHKQLACYSHDYQLPDARSSLKSLYLILIQLPCVNLFLSMPSHPITLF